MKILKVIVFLFLISDAVCADKKWIPLEPIDKKVNSKTTLVVKDKTIQIDISQIKPVKNMLNRFEIVKFFLDKETDRQKSKKLVERKKWFKLN